MRGKILLLCILLLLPTAIFAHAFLKAYLTDDFDAYLQTMGYIPLHPPRNEFHLGSLYDIDKNGNLDLVCPTTETMADSYAGPDTENFSRARSGSFSVIGDIADRLKASTGHDYSKNVRLSLRDIRLLQIPASKDGEIQDSLMKDKSCLRAVTRRLRVGHYICQVESSFAAIAVYEIDDGLSATATTKETKAEASADSAKIKRALTDAVQATTKMETKESGNNILTGNLVVGVKLEPVCISPLHAIFIRTWPPSAIYRGIDFVKYDVIEPLFVTNLFGEEVEATVASQE